MADKKQQLVLSIIDFLNTSIADGSVKEEDKEGLEVSVQCIGEAFGIDQLNDEQRARLSIKPASLPTIFDVYLKTLSKQKAAGAASSSSASGPKKPSAADKAAAEKLKATGNAHMTSKDYAKAIDAYGQSIALDPSNPVYYSNRAAAHSSAGDHASAVADAQKAIEVDPTFVKAYHRLGHAHFSQNNFTEAAAAFKQGLDLEPANTNLKTGYETAKARIPAADEDDMPGLDDFDPAPRAAGTGAGAGGFDFSSLAGLMGGAGRGGAGAAGGAGGMPDLAGLMNNPALMGMAQQMMANGGLDRLMQNPSVANMASRMQSGGGMPSMAEIMADPSLRELAGQFMGGAGRGGGAAPGAGGPPPFSP